MGAQQGKENRGSSSSVGSGSHGGKTTKHKSKSKDTRVSSGAGNIFTEHSVKLGYMLEYYVIVFSSLLEAKKGVVIDIVCSFINSYSV
ncbi:hypothetical protein TNIN_5851 [Trichonephila inaurata madagascariensis]|uniref:Uncharacterized protein n=1 Tax=Trichonephila inaurata madagascariensis TaxID=2747483 RepID=A0A8X6K4L3_9ARAC|nr:hypothetical protein TNIN_5851 [Trichonephila inaurata madagascariensis]